MLKYIKFWNGGGFVLFPQNMVHAEVAKSAGYPVQSAGFVCVSDGVMHCIGESISLGVKSAPGDSDELANWLAQVEGC